MSTVSHLVDFRRKLLVIYRSYSEMYEYVFNTSLVRNYNICVYDSDVSSMSRMHAHIHVHIHNLAHMLAYIVLNESIGT